MRISTVTIFKQSTAQLNYQSSAFMKISNQIASGKRVVNPSDDPLAMSKAIGITQSAALNTQYTDARVSAKNALSQAESVLNSVTEAITAAKTSLVQGLTDTNSNADRQALATQLQGIYETLLGQANAADGNGKYLFGGYQDNAPPFQDDGTGNIVYVGDQGQVQQRVDSARLMQTTVPGSDIFTSIYGSAGLVARSGNNTGSVQYEQPLPFDKSDPNYGQTVDITFSDVAGTKYYSINGGAPQAYTDGDKITANGMSIVLKGTPADGDSFQITSGTNSNSDMFKSLKDAIDALNNPVNTDTDKANLRNTLTSVAAELDSNLDKVLTVRASLGSKLSELDTIDSVSSNRALNYKAEISSLIDLDYDAAISEYTLKQTAISAAQKAFVQTQQMSLFNYIK